MRAPAAVLLLLLASFLSGCIITAPEVDEAPPAAADEDGWVQLALPEGGSATGVLGFWVPNGTQTLQVLWPTPGATGSEGGADGAAKIHTEGPRSLLAGMDDLLALHGPTGRLFAGTPQGVARTTNDTTGPFMVHEADGPEVGAYRLVRYGDVPWPQVRLLTGDDVAVAPLLPLPLTVVRHTLVGGQGQTGDRWSDDGTHRPPTGTVAVWPEALGVGFQAEVTIDNEAGARVAEFSNVFVARPTLLNVDSMSFSWFGWQAHQYPDALDGTPLVWSAHGEGVGSVVLYQAVAASLEAPHATPESDAAFIEEVALEGRIGPGEAGGLVVPAGAALRLTVDSSDERRHHAAYRVTDIAGRRVAWGEATRAGVTFAVPEGPLAIINDGPGEIAVTLLGAAPSDAALRSLPVEYHAYGTRMGEPGGGASETRLRIDLPGPAVTMGHSATGSIDALEVTALRADDAPVASTPDRTAYLPYEEPCCAFPAFVSEYAWTHWLDAGIHDLHLTALGGGGEVQVHFEVIDLDALYDAGA